MRNNLEAQREMVEADLGRLGNVLVYLHLVSDRIQAAARFNGNEGVLRPAVDDLQQAARLIKEVQTNLRNGKEEGNED